MVRKSASQVVLDGMQLTSSCDSPNTSRRFALGAMSAWSVNTRRAPSRHSRDARVYGILRLRPGMKRVRPLGRLDVVKVWHHDITYHTIPYHATPCHTVPYHTIPHTTTPHHTTPHIPYHTIPHHTIPYHTTPHHTIPYHAMPYHTIPYHTIPHHTIPYHTIPYHTIPYRVAPYDLDNDTPHFPPPRMFLSSFYQDMLCCNVMQSYHSALTAAPHAPHRPRVPFFLLSE